MSFNDGGCLYGEQYLGLRRLGIIKIIPNKDGDLTVEREGGETEKLVRGRSAEPSDIFYRHNGIEVFIVVEAKGEVRTRVPFIRTNENGRRIDIY